MKESIGYTVTLNIVIVFIVIIFAFLSAAIVYFKSNKVSNVVMNSIERYEGYNESAINNINAQMNNLGYNQTSITCAATHSDVNCTLVPDGEGLRSEHGRGRYGYCVYECNMDKEYYYYRIRTNMMIDFPIINDLLNIPIYSTTNEIYNYDKVLN